jgi:putative aldouronate transport system permease protein
MKTYFKSNIPEAIVESALLDGAGEFRIYSTLFLPLAKPVLATIGLFVALNYWNEWYSAMLYIQNPNLFPLQYFLYKIFSSIKFAQIVAEQTGKATGNLPQESFKYAMTIVTIGPVILLYPFIQKYFIKGMTIGSVKG